MVRRKEQDIVGCWCVCFKVLFYIKGRAVVRYRGSTGGDRNRVNVSQVNDAYSDADADDGDDGDDS